MAWKPEWDPIAFEYKNALRDLTFNSKPIINNLTAIAHQHISMAPAVARVLSDHLVFVPTFNPNSHRNSSNIFIFSVILMSNYPPYT